MMMNPPDYFGIRWTTSGYSLYTTIPILEGTIIAKEFGYSLSKRTLSPKTKIQVGEDLFLHYNEIPHYLDYVNHSCNPNMRYDTKLFAFFAIKDIPAGDSLTFDYEDTEYDLVVENEVFTCKCGNENCRIIIKGSKYRE